jgi:hypothetical protein
MRSSSVIRAGRSARTLPKSLRSIGSTLVATAVAVGAALASGGCATLSLATLGSVLGVAGSAASTGGAVFSRGKLDSAEMASADRWSAAVRAAAAELCLSVAEPRVGEPGGPRLFTLTDDHGSAVDVRIETRTATLLRNRIDVGLFGSEPTARLLLSRIRHHAGAPDETSAGRSDDH